MKTFALNQLLAEDWQVSPAAAADQTTALVFHLLQAIRRGQRASLPGLGTLIPAANAACLFRAAASGGKSKLAGRRPS